MAILKNIRFTAGQAVLLAATSNGLVQKGTGRPVVGVPRSAVETIHDMWMEVREEKRDAPILPLMAEVIQDTFRGGLEVRLLNLEEYLAS